MNPASRPSLRRRSCCVWRLLSGAVATGPSIGQKALNIAKGASELANKYSLAGGVSYLAGKAGINTAQFAQNHPFLSTIGTAFAGNTFSGISDTIGHVATGNFGAAYGDVALGGTAQGLPLSSAPAAKGIVGVATDGAVNAFGEATGLGASLGEEGLAGPVGVGKVAIDGAIYAAAVAYCTAHPGD